MTLPFGQPQYSAGKTYVRYVSPQEGKPIVGRIIPPIKDLAAEGKWREFHAVHFGYETPAGGNDPGKKKFELFACPLQTDWKTKVVKVPCPECAKIESVKAEIKQLQVLIESRGEDSAENEVLRMKNGYVKSHNRDSKWYLNFELEDGEVVVLMLSNMTCKDLLLKEIQKVKDKYGFDPLIAGVVWDITAAGKGLAKVDAVNYVTVVETFMKDGRSLKSETIKCVPWTEESADRVVKAGIDLRNPDRFSRISQEQIRMLVNCSGDPEEVAEIFGMGTRTRERSPIVEVKPIVNVVVPSAFKAPSAAAKPTEKVVVEEAAEEDEEAALLKQLAEAKARKAKAAAAAATQAILTNSPVSMNKKSSVDVNSMNDEEFMASIRAEA